MTRDFWSGEELKSQVAVLPAPAETKSESPQGLAVNSQWVLESPTRRSSGETDVWSGVSAPKPAATPIQERRVTARALARRSIERGDLPQLYKDRSEISLRIRAAGSEATAQDKLRLRQLDWVLDRLEMSAGWGEAIENLEEKASALREIAEGIRQLTRGESARASALPRRNRR